MPTFTAILTNAGIALEVAAIASGIPVQLTAIAVGDGNGNPTTPVATQTALVREVYRNSLSSISPSLTDASVLFAEVVIPTDQGGWAIREVGLYTSGGVLFAVANFPETYKPVISDGTIRDLVIRFGIRLSDTSAVTLTVDASIVVATRAWVLSTVTAGYLIPGGLTSQVLAKHSNAAGDFIWVDPTAAVNVTVDCIKELQTATAAQDTFTLAICTTVGVAVYVDGLRQATFTVLNSTQIQLPAGLSAGQKVLFTQNEPNEPLAIRRLVVGRGYYMAGF